MLTAGDFFLYGPKLDLEKNLGMADLGLAIENGRKNYLKERQEKASGRGPPER